MAIPRGGPALKSLDGSDGLADAGSPPPSRDAAGASGGHHQAASPANAPTARTATGRSAQAEPQPTFATI